MDYLFFYNGHTISQFQDDDAPCGAKRTSRPLTLHLFQHITCSLIVADLFEHAEYSYLETLGKLMSCVGLS